jgi:transposase-like protein
LKQMPNSNDYVIDLGQLKDKLLVNVANTSIRCKLCDSSKIVKYGHYKHVQYWWCKDCHHKFVNNRALPHMRYSSEEISLAARMFYGGISIKAIRETLLQEYNDYPSRSVVCNWIFLINRGLINNAQNYHPQTGDIWKVLETAHKLNGRKYWILDLKDTQTDFLLATVLSRRRSRNDFKTLIDKAEERAGKLPKQVLAERQIEYLEEMELASATPPGEIQIRPVIAEDEIDFEKKWNRALKERAEVMCDIREEKIARLILEGWLIYYNYCRPLQPPDNQTPAKRAGIRMIPSIRGIPHSFLFAIEDAINWV